MRVRERAEFNSAKFHTEADFSGLKVKVLGFRNVEFTGKADFKDAMANGAFFQRASFAADTDFTGFQSEKADFQRASWILNADFSRARLHETDFSSAVFGSTAQFTGAIFLGAMTFADACFSGAAYFDSISWPPAAEHFEGAFREARFERYVDFCVSSFNAFSAFDGASFKGEARFDSIAFKKDSGFMSALAMAETDSGKVALGHGLRTLRHAAENVRDRVSEQRYHRYELLTRRAQTDIGVGEKLVSLIYGNVSRYGYSMGLPMIWALGLWMAGTVAYLAIGAHLGLVHLSITLGTDFQPATYQAAQLSAQSIFSLFSVWTLHPPERMPAFRTFEDGLLWASPGWGLLTRLLSSFQSVLAGVLLFLVSLAVRRRFQIA